MGLRTSNSPWKTRNMRPDILRLEDRVVPGEMLGTSMFWAMGVFADAAVIAADYSQNDPSAVSAVRAAQSTEAAKATQPYVDSCTLAVCQVDSGSSTTSDDTGASAPQASADMPAATSASDEVFAGMGSDDSSGLFNDLSGGSSSMGDVLHPGAQTQAIPSAAEGISGATLQSGVPGMTAALQSSAGGSSAGSRGPGASLATLANDAGAANAGPTATAAATAQSAGAAATGGGYASPLYKAMAVAAPNKAHPNAANGAAPFSPAQIDQAYGINLLSNTGAGQTIYIVDAYNDPDIASNLATFDSEFGLAAPPSFTVHEMSSRVANSSSWGVEESLDVEWSHAIAPQANIVLVEATSSSNANLFAAVNYATTSGAKIVSMSWGGTDASSDTSYNSDFEHAGVTYIASAGDSASEIEYPAASPYVLAVGGTSLTLTTSNAYSSESAWSDGGGGVSKYEALPGYQSSFGITNSGRSIPDVAWDANPDTGVYVYDSFVRGGGGWYEVGGTSVGAPSWAGIVALADQKASTPLTTDSLTSRVEYSAASTSSLYASNYHDITTGSNCHAAGVGYDLATGIGSPQANNLVPWLSANG
jgi:hypothetical protein